MTDWNSLPLLLRVKDVQKVLAVSKNVAYELVNSKNFPALRVGRSFRVSRDALRAWVEAQAAGR